MDIKFRVRIKQELFQANMPETLALSGFAGGGGYQPLSLEKHTILTRASLACGFLLFLKGTKLLRH